MRKHLNKLALLLLLVVSISLTSCQKEDPLSTSDELAYLSFTSDELLEAEVTDCSLDKNAGISLISLNGDVEERIGRGHSFMKRNGRNPIRFEQIFRQLNLTAEQKTQLKALLVSHKECVKSSREAFLVANEEALTTAKTAREYIVNELKAGNITREEANEAIKEINKTLKEAIKNNTENEDIKLSIENCLKSLDESIEAILTQEQLEKWTKFKDTRPGRRG